MTQFQIESLHKLSAKDKLKAIELLWNDILTENPDTIISENHKKTLDSRINLLENGKTTVKNWSEIKNK